MKIFIKGETAENGIVIHYIDNITHERILEHISFNDYFYIGLEDFEFIKSDLKKYFGKYILKVVSHEAKNGFFAKIILRDNTKKHFIKLFLDEKEIKHYIADLDATKHYTIINFDELEFNLNESPYLFYDIETDDRRDFKYDDYGRVVPENTILSFCAKSNDGVEYKLLNEDAGNPECEKHLLLQIKEVCMKYSVISAWNGSLFDDVYLKGRAELHSISFIYDVNKVDYLVTYKKYRLETTLDSYSLDNVSDTELGEGKLEEVKGGGGRIYKLYLENKAKLLEYNMQDVELLYRLNKKLKFMELRLMTASLAKCKIELTEYNIGSNDYFILIKAYKRGIIAPSAPTKEEVEWRKGLGSIGGGYTRGFHRGFYEDVAVYDFESLYPTLEITFDISPETYVMSCTIKDKTNLLEPMHKNIKTFNNEEELNVFCKEHNYIRTFDALTYVAKRGREIYHPYRIYRQDDGIGMLPESMIESMKIRTDIKELLKTEKDETKKDALYLHQLSVKYILVSAYGLNASPMYRYFNFDLCDSITSNGQAILKLVNKFLEGLGCIVIYNDTDSVGFKRGICHLSYEAINLLVENLLDNLLKISNNNVYKRYNSQKIEVNHRLIMQYEKTFETLLYSKKKRYAGLVNGEIKVVGLESTQMNVLAGKLQNDFLNDVLLKKFNKEGWVKKIDELYTKCFSGDLSVDELLISKKFSKSIGAYDGPVIDKKTQQPKIKRDGMIQMKPIPAHIVLVKRMLEQGEEVYIGDKIQYIIKDVVPRQHVVSKEEFEANPFYDKEHYWQLIINPILKLMGLYMGKEAFDIIKIPERDILLNKIKAEQRQQTLVENPKLSRLQERLDKMDSSLLDDNTMDEMEREGNDGD